MRRSLAILAGLLLADTAITKTADHFRHRDNAALVQQILWHDKRGLKLAGNELYISDNVIVIKDQEGNIYHIDSHGKVTSPTELYLSRSDLHYADDLFQTIVTDVRSNL